MHVVHDRSTSDIGAPSAVAPAAPSAAPTPALDDQFRASAAPVAGAGARLETIVVRPSRGERVVLDEVRLDPAFGVEGDGWAARSSRMTPDGSADPDCQVTLINVRVLEAIEPDRSRWPLAGDQLLVDLDLSVDALPAGSRISIGSVVLELSATPHTGCAQFSARFGSDALRWINTPEGRAHRRRGANARVIQAGSVRVGDAIGIADEAS
jgi:MOSC domain-containing protein YiiM